MFYKSFFETSYELESVLCTTSFNKASDPLEEVKPDEDDPTQIPDNQQGPRAN